MRTSHGRKMDAPALGHQENAFCSLGLDSDKLRLCQWFFESRLKRSPRRSISRRKLKPRSSRVECRAQNGQPNGGATLFQEMGPGKGEAERSKGGSFAGVRSMRDREPPLNCLVTMATTKGIECSQETLPMPQNQFKGKVREKNWLSGTSEGIGCGRNGRGGEI
jgi:hypothetical protein